MDQNPWKILMVDDDEDDYILTRRMLSEFRRVKYDLEWAPTYQVGWDLLQKNQYDAILMDYDLGPKTGLQLAREAIANGCLAPILLLTGRGSEDIDLEAMDSGVILYLNKRETSGRMLERSIRYTIEHKQVESRLREREARYREISDTLPVGIAIFDLEGRLVESNRLADTLLGAGGQQALAADTSETLKSLSPEDHNSLKEIVTAGAVNGQRSSGQELCIHLSDGTILPVLASVSPVHNGAAQRIGAVVTLTDISERQRLEEKLKASELKFRELFRDAPAAIYEIDFRNRRFVSVNDAVCNLSGYSQEELLEMDPFEILDDAGKVLFQERIVRWLDGEQPEKNVEYKIKVKDGRVIDAVLNTTFLADAEGKPLGATVIAFDISERKKAEDALRQSQNHINRLVDTSFEGIWSVDREGNTTFVNQRAAEILGYTIDEILNRSAFEFLMPKEVEAGRKTLSMIANGESGRVEAHAQHKDGSEVCLLVSFSPVLDEHGEFKGALAMYSDITERKQTEEALRESEERFRTMADGTPLIIWVTDAEGVIEFINQAFTDFFNMTVDQLKISGWQSIVHPDDHEAYLGAFTASLSQQTPFHAEARIRRQDGEWRWVDSYGQPRFSTAGKFIGIAGSSVDITERKQMLKALERYTEQLKRSNQELENFAFMASHDLREPLRKIESFGRYLEENAPLNMNETERDYLQRMNKAAARMSNMIDDLLALSRVTSQGMTITQVDLKQVTLSVLDDLEVSIHQSGGKVEQGELPVIQGDRIQIHQLLQNLIGNALKFHLPDVPPRVKIWSRPEPDNQVEIFVEDDGIGFDMAHATHLFQPFNRLHGRSEYEGTGIGLSICRKIVERHGGSITARSQPGEGATFIVILPVEQPVKPQTGAGEGV